MPVALFLHTAEEFDIRLFREESDDESEISASVERTWVAQHEHDDEVTSIAIERDGDVDIQKVSDWLSQLLAEKGWIFFA